MWALVRSTWLAVGPDRDSLLLGSENNTPTLPAPLALLWSSNLVVLSSFCPLAAIQSHLMLEGCLWSLECLNISLGNKANCLLGPTSLWNSFILYSSCFLTLAHPVRLLTHSWVFKMKVNEKYLLLNSHSIMFPLPNQNVYYFFLYFSSFYALYLSRESIQGTLHSTSNALLHAIFLFLALSSSTRTVTWVSCSRTEIVRGFYLLSPTTFCHCWIWPSCAPVVTK